MSNFNKTDDLFMSRPQRTVSSGFEQLKDKYVTEFRVTPDFSLINANNTAALACNVVGAQMQLASQSLQFVRDKLESNPHALFNWLIICWQAGIYDDAYIKAQIEASSASNCLYFAIIYEASANYLAAKANY